MNQENIGKFIKELRKNNNMTQQDFANKYGVTYQAVSNWEHGKNIPDISLLKQMSSDFNVSIENLLDGKNNKKKFNYIYIFIFLIIILFIILIFIFNNNSYEFKTLSSNCEDFSISGSLSYDNKKTSIFINNVLYCGGDDEVLYKNIECILYEANKNVETKITSCNYESEDNIKLEDFLKDVSFTVDDYNRTCNVFNNNNLFLRINATDNLGKVTTYKIPLSLNDNCNN